MTKRSLLDTYLSIRQSSFHWTAMVGTFSVLSIITTIVLVLCALQAQLNKSQEKELEAIVLMQNASRRIAFCRCLSNGRSKPTRPSMKFVQSSLFKQTYRES